MDQTYIKAAIPLRDKMAFSSSPSSISSRRVFDPISNAPAMAILRSSDKAVKGKPQPKSFKELVSRIGQRSQLTAPKYRDSTKLLNNFDGPFITHERSKRPRRAYIRTTP
jgi:hypothetical protein